MTAAEKTGREIQNPHLKQSSLSQPSSQLHDAASLLPFNKSMSLTELNISSFCGDAKQKIKFLKKIKASGIKNFLKELAEKKHYDQLKDALQLIIAPDFLRDTDYQIAGFLQENIIPQAVMQQLGLHPLLSKINLKWLLTCIASFDSEAITAFLLRVHSSRLKILLAADLALEDKKATTVSAAALISRDAARVLSPAQDLKQDKVAFPAKRSESPFFSKDFQGPIKLFVIPDPAWQVFINTPQLFFTFLLKIEKVIDPDAKKITSDTLQKAFTILNKDYVFEVILKNKAANFLNMSKLFADTESCMQLCGFDSINQLNGPGLLSLYLSLPRNLLQARIRRLSDLVSWMSLDTELATVNQVMVNAFPKFITLLTTCNSRDTTIFSRVPMQEQIWLHNMILDAKGKQVQGKDKFITALNCTRQTTISLDMQLYLLVIILLGYIFNKLWEKPKSEKLPAAIHLARVTYQLISFLDKVRQGSSEGTKQESKVVKISSATRSLCSLDPSDEDEPSQADQTRSSASSSPLPSDEEEQKQVRLPGTIFKKDESKEKQQDQKPIKLPIFNSAFSDPFTGWFSCALILLLNRAKEIVNPVDELNLADFSQRSFDTAVLDIKLLIARAAFFQSIHFKGIMEHNIFSSGREPGDKVKAYRVLYGFLHNLTPGTAKDSDALIKHFIEEERLSRDLVTGPGNFGSLVTVLATLPKPSG